MVSINRSGPFIVRGWTLKNKHKVQFSYECAQFGTFYETVNLPHHVTCDPDNDAILTELFNLLAVFMGVSVYKCAAAQHIDIVPALGAAGQKAAKALYTEGLGEFFARNKLDYPANITFTFQSSQQTISAKTAHLDETRPILAFGGGKDSHVALKLLQSKGLTPELVSVVLSDKVQTRLGVMTDRPVTFIQRSLDERLMDLNKSGAVFNGHIPITAINAVILIIYAHLTKRSTVIFANEAGASVPTLEYRGHAVNHQYSKSYVFEGLLRDALDEISIACPDYFSLLRPVSELWIAQQFATKARLSWSLMASCNRNFVFAGFNVLPHHIRWCGTCAKCVYVAIILAPFLSPQDHFKIFEIDILNQQNNLIQARDLIGLGTAKPWECVGDFQDSFACLHLAAHDTQWANKAVLKNLKSELDALQPLTTSQAHFDATIASRSPHYVPVTFQDLIN